VSLNTFILNGEWVIIINSKRFQSIRVKLFMSFMLIGIITTIVLSIAFIFTIQQRYLTEKKRELYRQANTIAISLVTTGYFSDEHNNSYLMTVQASVSGRGMIIDRNGSILFDSNHLDEGKSLVNAEVLSALRGKSSYTFLEEMNIGAVTVPIVDLDYQTVLGAVVVSDSFNDITYSIKYLWNIALFFIVGLTVIIFMLSYFLSGSFNRPFRQFLDHINRITDGHIEEKIQIKGNTEIEEITTAFNHMFERIEAIESHRQEFVANVSHELKTPMSSIKVLAESLIHQPDTPIEIYQEFLYDINEEVNRETKIINDLLTLVTLDKKDNSLRIKEVDVNQLIVDVMKRLKPLADLKNIQMLFESYRNVQAEIDDTKMELAITNLIENAIKYNKEYGYINVSLDTDFKNFFIKIKDTGEGISQEHIDQVFRRFYRVDKTRSRDTGGTGLGLSIVQKTIYMHQGSIKCKSELGQWTEFIVTMPIKHIKRTYEEE